MKNKQQQNMSCVLRWLNLAMPLISSLEKMEQQPRDFAPSEGEATATGAGTELLPPIPATLTGFRVFVLAKEDMVLGQTERHVKSVSELNVRVRLPMKCANR